jgi:hypothetical protein
MCGINGYPISNTLQGPRRRASSWRAVPSVAYTSETHESLITEPQSLRTPPVAKENMKPGMSNEGVLSESASFRHPSWVRLLPKMPRV